MNGVSLLVAEQGPMADAMFLTCTASRSYGYHGATRCLAAPSCLTSVDLETSTSPSPLPT